jgi:hypothetical protein
MAEVYAGAGGTAGETPDASNLVKVDPKEIGMSVGLKQLFSGKEDKKGRFQWQATIPEDLPKPAEDAESAKWAIIVRNVRVFHDPKKVLSMHSIVIQSPYLKDLLAEVLAEYPGVTAHLARLEFTGRFEPLIHRWSELKSAIQAMKDKRLESQKLPQTNGHSSEEVAIDAEKSEDASSDAQSSALSKDPAEQETNGNDDASLDERIKHAELLYDLLSKEFADIIESSVDMKEKGVITYELLWTLFQPGMLVYSRQQGQDRVFSLSSARYGVDRDNNPVYWLMCEYHDWDGTNFGTNRLNMAIGIFEGTRSITSLQTLPWDSHGHKADIYTKLVERGTRVEELAGSHYRSYHGIGWRLNNMGRKERYNIKGRIVIDTLGFNRFNPDMAVYVSTLNSSAKSKPSSCRRILTPSGFISLNLPPMPGSPVDDYDPGYDLEDGGMPVDGFFEDETNERPAKKPLTDQQKLLLSPLVRGYALQEKLWLNFFVTAVHDVTFNERAFDSLVLPKNQKELILGFTSTQQGYRSQFDDVIEGKGRGIILLLCGKSRLTLIRRLMTDTSKRPTRSGQNTHSRIRRRGNASSPVHDLIRRPRPKPPPHRETITRHPRHVHSMERDPTPRRSRRIPRRAQPPRTRAQQARDDFPPSPRVLRGHHVFDHQPRRDLRRRLPKQNSHQSRIQRTRRQEPRVRLAEFPAPTRHRASRRPRETSSTPRERCKSQQ